MSAAVMVPRLVRHETALTELEPAVRELLDVLSGLQAGLKDLLGITDRKLAALRRADAAGLQELTLAEERALAAVQACDSPRRAALARLAQVLPQAASPNVVLSALAEKMPEPLASQILAKTSGLRDMAQQLDRKNRLAAEVARSLHSHIRAVFAEVAKAGEQTFGYGPQGRPATTKTRAWVDAVG